MDVPNRMETVAIANSGHSLYLGFYTILKQNGKDGPSPSSDGFSKLKTKQKGQMENHVNVSKHTINLLSQKYL